MVITLTIIIIAALLMAAVLVDLDAETSYLGQTYKPGKNVAVPEQVARALGLKARPVIAAEEAESHPLPESDALIAAGFTTADAVRAASDEELLAVPGIGPATLSRIREATGTDTV